METVPTHQTLSENEYSIVSLLNGDCLAQAIAIQDRLQDLFGDAIWLQEPPSLHITLMELICDTDYGERSRAKLFRQWYETYNSTVRNVLAQLAPFEIIFDEFIVSQRAIIIKASQSQRINTIRAQLLSNVSLPQGTKNPPDIVHSTLARFTRSVDLQNVVEQVKDIKMSATQQVTKFSLIDDLGPPIFNGRPLEEYSFGQ